MDTNSNGDIFLNGKAQIIEMLQYMEPEEKDRLLSQIRVRNSQLADELMANSVSFNNITELKDNELQYIFNYIKAPIMGVAIKGMSPDFQRRILSIANREYAERAYQIMTTALSNEARDIKRAREKVKGVISSLVKRQQLSL